MLMQNIEIKQVEVTSDSAANLMMQLDKELKERYPNGPIFGIDVKEFQKAKGFFVVAFIDEKAVGCGAFRKLTEQDAEIKRMFVLADYRRRGISRRILKYLEETAKQRGFSRVCLETGIQQPESISLYLSGGYKEIPLFGQYKGNLLSKCFEKTLKKN
jgi:GNAT superfamily N-acetyltransferase